LRTGRAADRGGALKVGASIGGRSPSAEEAHRLLRETP
jgi:hypothetical protein